MRKIFVLSLVFLPFLGMTQNQTTEKDENYNYTLGTELLVEEYDFISDIPKTGEKKSLVKKERNLLL